MKIIDIERIENVDSDKLNRLGIITIEDLLVHGATKSGRKELTEITNIDEAKILSWIKLADLFRIKGIEQQFVELLHAAGVDTLGELRSSDAENLHGRLVEIQENMKITHTVPELSQITDYISQANDLEPVVSY